MKRTIHASVCLFLAAIFLATTSICGMAETGGVEEQRDASHPAEQGTVSAETEGALSEANVPASFQACSMATDELDNFRYWLYTPENPTENMPLIVYLHGASGRGGDLNLVVADEDFPKYLQSGELGNVRAYVLIPQLPSELRGWSDISNSLYSLMQETIAGFSLDAENVSLAGFSMGGTATWELAAESPDLFARIAPLSGSARGVLEQVSILKEIPVRTFVGSADAVIAPNSSEQMVAELKKTGADAEITVFEGADHISVPSLVYHDESIHLIEWLIGAAE